MHYKGKLNNQITIMQVYIHTSVHTLGAKRNNVLGKLRFTFWASHFTISHTKVPFLECPEMYTVIFLIMTF